ncbi:MAG TPA: condensation domain-containing protein [Thermoanaerobaculia bacterium]|jgi:non-ribosomal peptide synthetase component F/aryl carrier-like protein
MNDLRAIYPLLPMQKGMLFHELESPEARSYYRQAAFRIEGDFDAALCARAWDLVAERHETLRSSFDYERTSQLIQIVHARRPVECAIFESDAELEAWRARDRERGFDLRRDALTRVAFFRHAPRQWTMVWSHPHILLDGWSGSVILGELAQIYAALRRSAAPALEPPPSYGAYVDWIESRDPRAAHEHWRAALDGYDTVASIFGTHVRAIGSERREHAFTIAHDDTAALHALAARNGVTAGTVLQTLWGILLARHNDRDDIVFGSVVSGRAPEVPDVERLVGLFINTVPLRVRIGEDDTFASLARQLQQAADAARGHDHLSLTDIDAAALIDHVVVFENYPAADACDTGFAVVAAEAREDAHYPFGVLIEPGPSLRVAFQYDPEVYTAAQMQRLEGHLRILLQQVLANDATPVAALDVLPPAESARLASFAMGAEIPFPDTTIHALFEAQAARTPEREAVVCDGVRLTYRELDERANAVAAALRARGVEPGQRVAVRTKRSAFRIAALLGVLKAGAVYVPISSTLPEGRVSFQTEDSNCVLTVDEHFEGGSSGPRFLGSSVDLAYVIYTSGSTGRPKGVEVAHRGFVNMILDQIRTFGIVADDRVLQFASCSFDASLSEIFMALLCGAAVVIAPDEVIRDGARFTGFAARERLTVATLPPSYLRALDRAELPLRVLITAGEPPDEQDARHYAKRLRYFNAYGPTEDSVCATMHEVAAEESSPGIPIGRPIANTRLRIADRILRDVPIGVPGEILLAGPGLARGYANAPALTARKFVEHGGVRWYRTGDRGLWTDDGEVLYLGRNDTLVKLRGYRIDLGEIESALRGIAGVRHAIAGVEDGQLVAWIAGETGELRAQLARVLPPHMVPSAFVAIDAVPLTTAGKIDRAALPSPRTASGGVAPRNAAEESVLQAWREVLGRDAIGVLDRFSDCGGDSLKAILLTGRLRRAGFAIDVGELLRLETVAAIAAASQQRRPHVRRSSRRDAPSTPVQRWYLETHARETWPDLTHAVLLRAPERLDEPAARARLQEALDAVVARHDALRIRFPESDRFVVGDVAPCRIENELQPFDLEHGPLFYAVRGAEPDTVLLAAHHLAVDAVSWRILLEDLGDAWRGATLPEPVTSYAEWARAVAASDRGDELPYWLEVDAHAEAPCEPHRYDDTTLEIVESDDALGLDELLEILASVAGPRRVQLSHHGRVPVAPGLDVTRTVGWFTADFPFLLGRSLRDVPHGGIGYGILKYHARERRLAGPPRIAVNHLGSIGDPAPGCFSVVRQRASAGRMARQQELEIEASIERARLTLATRSRGDTALSRALRAAFAARTPQPQETQG